MKVFISLIFLFSSLFASNKQVGMWVLMLWFNDAEYKPWEQYVRYKPEKGMFNSLDKKYIEYVVKSAEELGVDYLILDNTNGIYRHNGMFEDIIREYISVIKKLKSNLKIVIAIGHSIYHHKNFELLRSNIHHFKYSYFHDEVYYKVNNKPLLILYINPDNRIDQITNDKTFLQYISENDEYGYKTYFNDISLRYASVADSWLKDKDGIFGWQYLYPQNYNKNVMGVMPGWDRSHNSLTGSTPVSRNNGKYYIDSWERILKYKPDTCIITSFDDFAEETFISNTEEYKNLYFNLTKEYIKKFKSPKVE